jgi:hypothetical protein
MMGKRSEKTGLQIRIKPYDVHVAGDEIYI